MLVRILRQRPMVISCPEAKQSRIASYHQTPKFIAFPTATGAKFKFLVISWVDFLLVGQGTFRS